VSVASIDRRFDYREVGRDGHGVAGTRGSMDEWLRPDGKLRVVSTVETAPPARKPAFAMDVPDHVHVLEATFALALARNRVRTSICRPVARRCLAFPPLDDVVVLTQDTSRHRSLVPRVSTRGGKSLVRNTPPRGLLASIAGWCEVVNRRRDVHHAIDLEALVHCVVEDFHLSIGDLALLILRELDDERTWNTLQARITLLQVRIGHVKRGIDAVHNRAGVRRQRGLRNEHGQQSQRTRRKKISWCRPDAGRSNPSQRNDRQKKGTVPFLKGLIDRTRQDGNFKQGTVPWPRHTVVTTGLDVHQEELLR